MDLIFLLRYALWRIAEILFARFNIYMFVKTREGLKNINISPLVGNSSVVFNSTAGAIEYISPQNLFLGPDFLKDKYTLLNCCILDSPHYAFIKAVNEGEDLTKTDYYKRFVRGKLDGRHCQKKRDMSYFYNNNEKAKKSIEEENYKPVIVYNWKNHYYVCDGKHRASLCALLNKNVRCIVISPVFGYGTPSINEEMYRIIADDCFYSKHINFIKNEES